MIEKTVNAGSVIKKIIYPESNISFCHSGGTSTAMDHVKNSRKSIENLNLKIGLNFEAGESWFLTLTLKGLYAKDMESAIKLKNKIIRFLAKYFHKKGCEFKTTGIIERGHNRTKRLHMHMVIPKIVFTKLNQALRNEFPELGYVKAKRLYKVNEDFYSLAKYMLKDRKKENEYKSRRFSHNLESPDVHKSHIASKDNPIKNLINNKSVEEIKGYSLNKEKCIVNNISLAEPTGVLRYDKN